MKGFVRMPNVSRLLTKKQIISLLLIICMAMIGTFWFLGCNKTSFTQEPYNVPQEEEKTLARPTDGTTPADHTALDNYYIATGVLKEAGSFVGTTTGSSVSLGITQDIYASRTVLGNDVFKESYSFGVKKVGAQIYVSGKNYVMRDTDKLNAVDDPNWSNSTPYKISEDTYLGKFGGKPLGICNYIVKEETVTSAQYLGVEDGLHAFRYDFDIKTATPKMLREMKTMSGMDSTFNSAAIIVYMDDNWVVKKTTTDCEYVVSYGPLTPTCEESITEVFTALGENTPLPHEDVFGPYLEAEITDVVEKDPTALDYIMNGFGAYMAGTPLLATIEADGIVGIKGAASVNIDINELSNIKARVLIDKVSYGDISLNDLFVAYSDNTVYIKYDDLKAKATVSDITALVGKITALLSSGDDASDGSLFGDLDTSALLDGMTLTQENGVAVVGITIPLGDVTITATLDFTDGETISFIDASAVIACANGETILSAVIKPVESVSIPEVEGTYYDIVPLVDEIIDEDGNICVSASVDVNGVLNAPILLNAKVNLSTLRVDASGKIGNNTSDLRVRFDKSANVIYLALGDLKASFKLEDIPSIKDKFAGLLSSTENNETAETESASVMSIVKDILDTLTITENNGKLTIAAKYSDLNASIVLTENNGAYGLGNISADYDKLHVTATTCDSDAVKVIDDSELSSFKDIVPVLDVIDDNLSINLKANISVNVGDVALSNVPVEVSVGLKPLTVMAKATIFEKDVYVKYADDTVYVSALGINAKASKDDISSLVAKFKNIFSADSDSSIDLDGLLDSIDLDSIIASIKATAIDGGVTLGGNVSIDNIGVVLGTTLVDNGTAYRFGNVSAEVNKDNETIVSADITSVSATELDFSPIADTSAFYDIVPLVDEIIDENGNICVSASVDVDGVLNAPIVLNAKVNLSTLRVDASGKIGNNTSDLRVRFDKSANVIYLALGDLKASFKLEDIPSIKDKFAGLLSSTENNETAETESASVMSIVKDILDTLTITENDGKLTIAAKYSNLNASIVLTENNGAYGLGNISADYDKLHVTATTCAGDAVKVIDDSELSSFKDIVPVLDVIDDNLSINLKANISVNVGDVALSNVPVEVSVGLKPLTVMAKATIFEKDVYVKYADDTVYVSALGINAKASKDDISSLVAKLKNIFSADSDSSIDLDGLLDSIDLDSIISSIKATAVSGGVTLGGNISIDNIGVALGITLVDNGTAYRFDNVSAEVNKDNETIVSADITSVSATELDFSPIADTSAFYDIVPLVDEIIDEDGNIKLQLSIDTDMTDAIGDAISGAITSITDGKTEVVEAEKQPIVVTATMNLKSMRITANVLGINLLVDLKTNMVYAECGGAKVFLECGENFGNIKSILEKLLPTIQVFAPEFELSGDSTIDIMATVEKLVKAITSESSDSGVVLSLPIEVGDSTINASVVLTENGSTYSFGGIVLAVGGTKMEVTSTSSVATAPNVFDSDGTIKSVADLKACGYIDLYEVVDKFADTVNNIFVARNLEVTLGDGCVVTLNGTTIALSGSIKVSGVNKNYNDGVIKVNADLVVTITKDGNVKTYGLTVIYTTPLVGEHYTETTTTDANNAETVTRTVLKPNAYFKLDRKSDDKTTSTGKPIIGTFSTAVISETMDVLKTIYNNMPELQESLSFLIPESKDGKFHMPSISDIGALVDSFVFDSASNTLSASITVAPLIHDADMQKKMSDPIVITLSALENSALGVTLSLGMKDSDGNTTTSVALNGSAQNVADFTSDTFTYNASENTDRTSDFTSINDLLRALAKTSENRHFEMSANIKLKIIGSWEVELDLTVALDVEGKNTYVTANLTRHDFTGASVVYSDKGGTTTLYYYGEKGNEMFYVHNHYCTRRKLGLITAKYSDEYLKYTKQEFSDNLLDIMLKDILHFSSTITDQISKSEGSTDINIEDIFTKYSYSKDSSGNNQFNINLSLNALTGGTINDIPLTITSDSSDTFKSITTTFDISVLTASLDASITGYAKDSQNIKTSMPTPSDSTYSWSSYHNS